MAASFLEVTPGSGLKLATFNYTEGANSVHDQKMILGEQYLPTYWGGPDTTGVVSLATGSSHVFQLMAGASLKLRVRYIDMYQVGLATTASVIAMYVLRLTTAGTGGTVNGRNGFDLGDAGAGATLMTLPTVKGTEGGMVWNGSVYLMQTVGASAQLAEPSLRIDFDRPRSKPLIIGAGTANGIALKTGAAAAGATVFFNVYFDESSF